jgi:thymidine phosphorylase
VGVAAWRLGAGRARKEDPVSATAGVVCVAKPGDRVEAGDTLLELHTDDAGRFPGAREALAGAVDVADAPPPPAQLIAGRVAEGELPERSEESQRALGARARRASGGRSAPHESM